MIRQILIEARQQTLKEAALIFELGDEFGDTSFDSSDLTNILPDVGNVTKTMVGSVLNVGNKVHTLVSTFLRGLPSIVVPFVQTRYDKIYKDEQTRQREIERMYPEIFSIARKGFVGDGQLFAFMLDPVIMTMLGVGHLGGDVALDLIDGLSGSSPDVITRTRPLRRRVSAREGRGFIDSQLLEWPKASMFNEPTRVQQGAKKSDVVRLLQDDGFQRLLGKAEPVRKIVEAARNSKNTTLNDIIKTAKQVADSQSIEDLVELGLKFGPDLDKIKQQIKGQGVEALDLVIAETKGTIIQGLIKKNGDQLNDFKNSHVPVNSSLFKVYGKTNDKLKEMLKSIKVPTSEEAGGQRNDKEPGSNGGVTQPPPVA